MGRFAQKGLCYSFKFLHGLLSNKNIRIPMKIKFQGPPQAPQKSNGWWLPAVNKREPPLFKKNFFANLWQWDEICEEIKDDMNDQKI